jgi:hypothetical protein
VALLASAGVIFAVLLLIGGVAAARSLFLAFASQPDTDRTFTGDERRPDAEQAPSGQAGPPVSDLAFVPGDARGLFSVRVAELWNSRPIQKAWMKLPEDVRARVEQASQQIGFDMTDYDRITAVIKNEVKQEIWAVIRTTRPFDRAKREKLLQGAREIHWEKRSYKGFGYQLATAASAQEGQLEPLAVYLASDHVLVAGTEPGLHGALDYFKAGGKGGDQARARVLDLIEQGKHHVVMAAVLNDDDRAELKPPPGVGFLVSAPKDVKAVLVTARLGATVELMGIMTYPDAGKADETRRQLEGLKQLGLPLIQFGEANRAKSPQADLLKLLTAIKTEVNGPDLELRAEIDLDKLAPLLPSLVASQAQIHDEGISGPSALKELALAFERYHEAHGSYPKAVYYSKDRTPLYSWRVALLPYLGERKLYDQFDKERPWNDPKNIDLLGQMPKVYALPGPASVRPMGQTCFQLLTGRKAAFHEDRMVKKEDLADGAGRTILLVEHQRLVPWTAPLDISLPDELGRVQNEVLPKLGLFPGDTFQVVLFDGSIHRMKRTMKAKDFLHAVNPRDGVGLPRGE